MKPIQSICSGLRLHCFVRCAALLAGVLAGGQALAQGEQAYPNRLIRIVVGQAPGGINDVLARLYAQELTPRIRQQVIVEHKPGGEGVIGARVVSTAPPDGYTLHIGTSTNQSRLLLKNGLDLLKELAPVSVLVTSTYVLFSSGTHPFRTLADVVAWSKANPSVKLNFGSAGAFNLLAMAMISDRMGVNYITIPYKGASPAAQALAANEIDLSIGNVPPYLPLIKAGKIRALVAFNSRKLASLPDAASAPQAGLSNFNIGTSNAIWAPPATPKEVIARISSEFAAITRLPGVQDRIRSLLDAEPIGSTPEEMRRIVEADLRFWEEAVRVAQFTPE